MADIILKKKRVESMPNSNNIRDFSKEFLAFWNQPLQKHLRFIFNVSFSVIKNLLFILLCGLILLGIFGTGIGLGYFASLTANEKPLTQE